VHPLLNGIAVWFQSQARLEAEVLMLRHQVNVLAGSAAMMRPAFGHTGRADLG
jgi:hypothetical protein